MTIILNKSNLIVNISGDTNKVVSTFLRVYLANDRLTDKQLEVTTALVSLYAEYNSNGVKEPYASQLLFSTESRKSIIDSLGITAAHLNNTFNALATKFVLAKEHGKYVINPAIIPSESLVFKFKIDDQSRQTGKGSGDAIKSTDKGSAESNKEPVLSSQKINDD